MFGSGTTEVAEGGLLYVSGGGHIANGRLLNNRGKVAYGTAAPINVFSGPSFFQVVNSADDLSGFNGASQTAWNQYVGAIESATGNAAQPEADSFHNREMEANDLYVEGEAEAASEYEEEVCAADEDLFSVTSNPNATDDEIADAEAIRDDRVTAAGEEYARKESILYDAYKSQVDYLKLTLEVRIGAARTAFSQAVRNASRPGAQIFYPDGSIVSGADIETLVDYVWRRLEHPGDFVVPPDDGAGLPVQIPSLANMFATSWSAETRAALIAAYSRFKGVHLQDHIHSKLGGIFGNVTEEERRTLQALEYGQFEETRPDEVDREGFIGRLSRWGRQAGQSWDQATTFLGSLSWDGVVSAAEDMTGAAWAAATTYVSNTIERAAADPLGFAQTVVAGYVEAHLDVATVAANTFTFGLIPQLNDRTTALVAQNGFYRVVQIGAVVGREFALTALTGGVGNVIARAGVGVAGALALRMGVTTAAQARFVCMATSAQRLAQPYLAYRNLDSITANADRAAAAVRAGNYEQAAALLGRTAGLMPNTITSLRETARLASATASLAAGNPQRIRDYLTNCFAAGTPVLGEFGSKPIEEFKAGERVWARDENDAEGPARLQVIEETFQSVSEIWRLNVGGRAILTTREHPFWVVGRGWVELHELRPGDRIAGMSGEETPVHSIEPTGQTLAVYNFRVAGDHTYFVGSPVWGFSLWAHNACWIPRAGMAQTTRGTGANRTIVLGTAQMTTGSNGPAHVAEIMRQVDEVIAREGNKIAYIVLNRSMRTAVGRGFSTSRVRPDITIVYKPSAGGRVSVREIGSPGQTRDELRAQQVAALGSLTGNMRGARPDPTLFGEY